MSEVLNFPDLNEEPLSTYKLVIMQNIPFESIISQIERSAQRQRRHHPRTQEGIIWAKSQTQTTEWVVALMPAAKEYSRIQEQVNIGMESKVLEVWRWSYQGQITRSLQ